MKFVLEIELGNEAMKTPLDVSNALYLASINLSRLPLHLAFNVGDAPTRIRDANGNTVGRYEVVEGAVQ